MENSGINSEVNYGNIRISDEVVATISGIAAIEIEGVAGMSGGIVGGIEEMLGRKNLSKGVKVDVGENETKIDLFVILNYGVKIPQVSEAIQERVKKEVESMTGLEVTEVNVFVQGIATEKDEAKIEE